MKKSIRTLVGVVSLGLAVSPALAADLKVGIVDGTKVLEQAPQVERLRVRLEKEFATRDRNLTNKQKEIRRLEEKLERDGVIMGERERTDLERDVRAKKREIRRQLDEYREDLNLRRNEGLQQVQRHVLEVIEALAKREKFDLIMRSEAIIFASKRVNVTAKVVEMLKKEFKSKKK